MKTPYAPHNALQAAKARIAGAKRKRDDPEEDEEKEREDVLGQLKHVSVYGVWVPGQVLVQAQHGS